jgi:outer membrane protein OmpU
MKKVLFASTALVLSAGVAAAEVAVSGDGRMGVIDTFGPGDLMFTSRIRIKFTATGETDGGLAFGGSIRADNAVGGAAGTAGSVFVSGAFGKLSMGDVDGAAKALVGHVSGVGLTGLGDLNEITYIANAGTDPAALYEYSFGAFTFAVSADQTGGPDAFAVGGKYAPGNFSVALGYEDNGAGTDHIVVGGDVTFGAATLKARYGEASGVINGDQYAVSMDYAFGMTTITAFYTDDSNVGGAEAYGIGAAYDLGGGASLKGGYVSNETANTDAFDFGVAMTF